MGADTAQAIDGRVVKVRMPEAPHARVAFMADIENLQVERATPAAKVVINARTGSVVMNKAVTLAACAVAHGSLSVTISTTPTVSQPNPLAAGQTTVTEKSDITIKQEPGALDRAVRRHQPGRGGQGAEFARRDAAGSAGDPAGDQVGRRAERRSGGDLMKLARISDPARAARHAAAAGTAPAALAGDVRSTGALKSAAGRDPKGAIKDAARQFEALFMQELMKSMRQATLATGMLDNDASRMGTEMLDQQFATQMTGMPGGLAAAIARQLERQLGGARAEPTPPPARAGGRRATTSRRPRNWRAPRPPPAPA